MNNCTLRQLSCRTRRYELLTIATGVALLLVGPGRGLTAQTEVTARRSASVAPTLSLEDVARSVNLEADDPDIRYQNGFFFNIGADGRFRIRNREGHIIGDFQLHPRQDDAPVTLADIHDVAVFKDGSIAASWIYMLPHDRQSRRYFSLVHYDPAGAFLEQIDLGRWRARKICIADDNSLWTLSGEEEMGHAVYSPEEGVLRHYKFGSGLLGAAVPRSNFMQGNVNAYAGGNVAIDCSGDKVHLITSDGRWTEYTPGGDFTITPIEPLNHSSYGNDWRLVGFAYVSGRAYALIHSSPGDPFRGMFAELLPSGDGTRLRWTETSLDQTILLTGNPSPAAAGDPPGESPEKAQESIVVTGVLGADREDGGQLVLRTSADDKIRFSKPLPGN